MFEFDTVTVNGVEYPITAVKCIDPEDGVHYLGFKLTIGGKERALRAKYHLQAQAHFEYHGLDIEEELRPFIIEEITNEIKRYLESV